MCAMLAENTKTRGDWTSGCTGFNTESTPTMVAWKDMAHIYYQEEGGQAIRRPVSMDSATWEQDEDIGLECGDAPCAIVNRGGNLQFYYREAATGG
jgi:hypothetical protein